MIKDFSAAQGDVIDLSRIDANVNTTDDDGFTIVGSHSHTAVELRITTADGNSVIQDDINGDGHDDFHILVHGIADLSSEHFMLQRSATAGR